MLRFDNLAKRYDQRTIFQELHFSTAEACIALSDESGSGKSTLLAILAGTIDADTGDVWLGGHSLRASPMQAKSVVTYVTEDCMSNPLQTGREYLEHVASVRRTSVDERTLDLAGRFGLAPHLDKRFEQMSLGTRKKIYLTAAAFDNTSVVIADEPGGGLDAAARIVLADLFSTLARDRTVFFSSYDTALIRACGARTISFADLGSSA